MKGIKLTPFFLVALLTSIIGIQDADAQILKKLKKKAENAATRKLEDKTEKETNRAMDSMLNNGGNATPSGNTGQEESPSTTSSPSTSTTSSPAATEPGKEEITIYSKSDWVAGEQIIFFEDFSNDPVGDFPQLWDTDASGEIITLSSDPDRKWLKMYNIATYQPDLPKELPRDFTIEFDALAYGVTKEKTSQTARFNIMLGDGTKKLKEGYTYARAYLPVYQAWLQPINFKSAKVNVEIAGGRIERDLREAFSRGCHIAISVKEKRYRLYVDGEKILDFPRAMPEDEHIKTLLFSTYGMKNEAEHMLITNIRIAEGLPEPRAKLFSTGKYVTNAIHFDVNSATIKPQSYPILREIAEAVKTEKDKKILIVGHTDSDGSDSYNLELSKKRAAAVKDVLTNSFGVSPDQLSTDGKGEAEPIASNTTASDKAKNRRTEFIVR